jgi:hypothetical protein
VAQRKWRRIKRVTFQGIDMSDIPVDRAGRPMYDAEGRKLSIAEREAAAESQIEKEARMRLDRRLVEVKAELKTAEAAHHYVVLERDKLREENTALREAIQKHKGIFMGETIDAAPVDYELWEALEETL